MKILITAHVITAILLWGFIVIAGIIVRNEGDLIGIAALCLIPVATFITIVDISSVYLRKKEKVAVVLPIISTVFWGLVFIIYIMVLFSPNQPWEKKSVLGIPIAIALFKVIASVSLIIEKLPDFFTQLNRD